MPIENNPIFVVGAYRSGTSVLTWCLGQHPNIMPVPETHWIARLAVNMRLLYRFGTVNGRYSHLGALGWSEGDFYAAFGKAVNQFVVDTREPRLRFIESLAMKQKGMKPEIAAKMDAGGRLSPYPGQVGAKNYQVVRSASDPKQRWVDGTPENTPYIYALSMLFPGAKFIHILRHPDDVARSLMHFSKAGNAGVDYGEAQAYKAWQTLVERAVKAEQALGRQKVARILYDDLVGKSDSALRNCLDFLGEGFTSDVLLPLKEKINSSKIEADGKKTRLPSTREGKAANEYFRRILDSGPAEPDADIFNELADHFCAYADEINK